MRGFREVNVTWDDIDSWCEHLANMINTNECNIKRKDLTGVYGIPRGGLVLATIMSHKLDLPMLMAPCEGCLILDDIADSGRSLIHYTDNDTQFNKYFIATYFWHPRSLVKPHMYCDEKEGGTWIVFPWEN